MKLGKIEKLDLRDIWANEASDFTPWLAKPENIKLLGDTIGIDLEVESQEKSVGAFRADILARDMNNSNHYVLIENQLEPTNHNHLGQIITYAAGLDACSIIWIAKSFTEEHRAALDWLNRITDENINFFGIEIEVIRIGESVPAPQFNVFANPNDWSKTVRANANSGTISDTKIKQQEYWTAFRKHALDRKVAFKVQKPLPQHWTNIAIGKSGFHLSLIVNSAKNEIRIDLEINSPTAKQDFDTLKSKYEEDARIAISPDLEWCRLDSRKSSMVRLSASHNFLNQSNHEIQFDWFIEYIEKFINFFKPKIQLL